MYSKKKFPCSHGYFCTVSLIYQYRHTSETLWIWLLTTAIKQILQKKLSQMNFLVSSEYKSHVHTMLKSIKYAIALSKKIMHVD